MPSAQQIEISGGQFWSNQGDVHTPLGVRASAAVGRFSLHIEQLRVDVRFIVAACRRREQTAARNHPTDDECLDCAPRYAAGFESIGLSVGLEYRF